MSNWLFRRITKYGKCFNSPRQVPRGNGAYFRREISSEEQQSTHNMSYNRVKFDQFGDPAKILAFETVNGIPTPKDDEIVINIIASPIDPFDFVIMQGVPMAFAATPTLPASPGCEGVGRIHSIGKNVTGFEVGQRVAFYSHTGAWSEYLVLKQPFNFVIPVPDNLSDTAAGQFAVNPYTAYGLFDTANPSPGEWVLQTGAGSVLGQMAIEMAKAKNINIISVVRRKEQIAELKARYSSDIHVVAFDGSNEDEALAEVNTITQNKGVNYVFEAVSGPTFNFALKTLATNGRLLTFGSLSKIVEVPVPIVLLRRKNLKIEGFVVTPWMRSKSPAELKKVTEDLINMMVSKQVVPAFEAAYSYEHFKEAIARSVSPGKLGRVFLTAHPDQLTK